MLSELEFFFLTALNCDNIDHCFVFNSVVQYILSQLMNQNGLHLVLEKFANMIQVGKNIALNDQTVFTFCTSSPFKSGMMPIIITTKKLSLKRAQALCDVGLGQMKGI